MADWTSSATLRLKNRFSSGFAASSGSISKGRQPISAEASSIKINSRELVHGMDSWKSLPPPFPVLEVYRYRYTNFFPVSTV